MRLVIGHKKKVNFTTEVSSLRMAFKRIEVINVWKNSSYALVFDKQKHPIAQFLKSSMDGQWYQTYLKKR